MNISDKINILNLRILNIQEYINEHNRILDEEYHLLSEGDEEAIKNRLLDLNRSINALNDAKKALTNKA